MIEIKPSLQYQGSCPHCTKPLIPNCTLWQGMHIYFETTCSGCKAEILEQLQVGHTPVRGCQVDLKAREVFGDQEATAWFGKAILQALQQPNPQSVAVVKEVFQPCERVILLNCIDYLYGHSLLKLLNVQRHLEQHQEYGVIVIVPQFLRWMVPQGVAEIWTVDIPLKQGQNYYPEFNQFVLQELERFTEVQVSEAYSHPSLFDITQFTGIPPHEFAHPQFNITFIWREDRFWCRQWLFRVLRKLKLLDLALMLQNWKVHRLMRQLKTKVPHANYVVAGLGKKTRFSDWIKDLRTDAFDAKAERQLCRVYSDSRLVIGVHGSNMLLPSGHAGMTIDLLPGDRWGNFAQDVLYQEPDPRLAAYRYRFLPIEVEIRNLVDCAANMITTLEFFHSYMTADQGSDPELSGMLEAQPGSEKVF